MFLSMQEIVALAMDVRENVVINVSLGTSHSAAITTNGDLYCWGDNGCGQVGNGTIENQTKPVKVLEKVICVE